MQHLDRCITYNSKLQYPTSSSKQTVELPKMSTNTLLELSDHNLLVHVQVLTCTFIESKELEFVGSAVTHELLGLCALAQVFDFESLEVRQSGFQTNQLFHQ